MNVCNPCVFFLSPDGGVKICTNTHVDSSNCSHKGEFAKIGIIELVEKLNYFVGFLK